MRPAWRDPADSPRKKRANPNERTDREFMDYWEYEPESDSLFEPFYDADADDRSAAETDTVRRLDALLPADPQTGAVAPFAFLSYLSAMMAMADRYRQPLSLLAVSVSTEEETRSLLRRFGTEGANLIGRAVARCLRQETRIYDVVGCASELYPSEAPIFLVVCPLRAEAQAALLAERLRDAMIAYAEDPDCPWLKVSVGVAAMALDTPDPEALIARGIQALYQADRSETGGVWRHSDTVRRIAEENSPQWPDETNS